MRQRAEKMGQPEILANLIEIIFMECSVRIQFNEAVGGVLQCLPQPVDIAR